MRKYDSIIVGAGLSVLVLGYELTKSGHNIRLLEKSNRCGGALRSIKKDGFLLEVGPNTVMAKPEILNLIEELGLTEKLVTAPKKSPRYIQFKNRLHRLPPGPLGPAQLIRAACELFIKKGYGLDESVWSFFQRRFGTAVAERLVSPFVSGIWAGDAKNLSIQAAFPQLVEWESEHGSVIKALFSSKKKKEPQKIKGLISFHDGIETLTIELTRRLQTNIHTNTTISHFHKSSNDLWEITTDKNETIQTNNIIFSCPTFETADTLRPLFPAASNALRNIPYAPIKVVHLGFHRKDIEHPLMGFGYLAVPSESKNILGCLWSSSLFGGRSPDNSVLLTLFIGGMTNKDITKKNDTEILNLAMNDVSNILGIKSPPYFTNVTTYERAIPQYTMGHKGRIEAILELQRENPGLWFSGNYLEGISVGDVIKNALKTADQLQKSVRD